MTSFFTPEQPDLTRRGFASSLGGALAAPALILPGQAFANEDAERLKKIRSLIAVSILRRRVTLQYLLLQTSSQILGVSLSGQHEQRDESRLQLGGILASLQRPTIATMLTQSFLAGTLFLSGRTLYMRSLSEEVDKVLAGMQLVLVHQKLSWQPGRFKPVSVTGFPIDAQIEQMRQVGEIFVFQQKLALAMIYPVLGQESASGF